MDEGEKQEEKQRENIIARRERKEKEEGRMRGGVEGEKDKVCK